MTAEQLRKEWEGMTDEQKAAATATVLDFRVFAAGHFWENKEGTVVYEVGDQCGCAPCWHPHTNRDQAALVVAEIERQGLAQDWLEVLERLVDDSISIHMLSIIVGNQARNKYQCATASADMRCAAAWVVWKMKEQDDATQS